MDVEIVADRRHRRTELRKGRLSRRTFLTSTLSAGGSAILLAACAPPAAPATNPPATLGSADTRAVAPAASAPASQAASASAGPASLTTVRISDAQLAGNFLPTYIALDGGIFRSNGLDASLTVGQSSATMASLLAGQIDVGETSGAELVNALAGGADLVAIATLVPVYPFRFFVQADIQQPDDLKGKTVGITNFGTAIDLATRIALTRLGLDPKRDVTLLPLSSVSARTSAMVTGQIAGGLSLPPDWITLEASGLHAIFDLAQAGVATSVVMQIVQRSYVTGRRDLVQRFVDAIVQAIVREKHDEAFATAELRKFLNYDDPRGLKETYDFFSQVVHPSLPYPDVAQLQEAYESTKRDNPPMANVNLANAVDRSFVQSAAERGLQTA
jgi:NitT/TauT family transport system substrate-binding protein